MKYEISFKADLTPEKKELLELHFANTLKLMGIEPEALSITLREKPDPIPAVLPAWNFKKYEPSLDELLQARIRHIGGVTKCFEACKSKSDVARVIRAVPGMFGSWNVEFDDEDRSFTVINTFFDDELGEDFDEEYWYDYTEDWEDYND